jgi:hypothetical protein
MVKKGFWFPKFRVWINIFTLQTIYTCMSQVMNIFYPGLEISSWDSHRGGGSTYPVAQLIPSSLGKQNLNVSALHNRRVCG